MLKLLLQRWQDWTGDRRLTEAIQRELRRSGYAVHAAQTRRVELAAIQRPGWVQVYRFGVATRLAAESPHARDEVFLYGLSRDDGRRSRIEVLLTPDPLIWRQRFAEWSDGLIVRRGTLPE